MPVALDRGGPLINCKPSNLQERPGLSTPVGMDGAGIAPDPAARAPAEDGRLREDEGRNFHALLDLSRWHANQLTHLVELGDDTIKLQELRRTPQGLATVRSLAGMAWTYWDTPASPGQGIHAALVRNAEQNIQAVAGSAGGGSAAPLAVSLPFR